MSFFIPDPFLYFRLVSLRKCSLLDVTESSRPVSIQNIKRGKSASSVPFFAALNYMIFLALNLYNDDVAVLMEDPVRRRSINGNETTLPWQQFTQM